MVPLSKGEPAPARRTINDDLAPFFTAHAQNLLLDFPVCVFKNEQLSSS